MVGDQAKGQDNGDREEHTVPITLQIGNQTGRRVRSLRSLAQVRLCRKEDMTNIEEELKKAQEILDNNPVLEYSPGDLSRMGRTVEDYLSRWPQADKEKYRDYYQNEL